MMSAEDAGGKKLDFLLVVYAQIDQLQRARSMFEDDKWYEICSFVDPQHARSFRALFAGEMYEAAN
jgi:hypothetical protein